jgi:hypothetical protein
MVCRQNKKIFLAVFITIMLLFGVNSAYAAWWDIASLNKGLSVPSDAEEVKREERLIAGNKFDFIYYVSKSDITVIKNFYRSKLAASGWVEQELAQDLKQLPGVKINPDMEQTLGYNLSFSKDEEQLIISFLPSQYSRDNKTRFTVCYGKIAKDFKETQETPALPALIDKPKKDVAPVYPEASLVALSEQAKSLKASYAVKADIEGVLVFYKENMPGYGWSLVNEKPIDRKTAGGLSGLGLEDCPSCKNSLSSAGNAAIELRFGQLDFSNQAGDRCSIMASNAKSPQGTPSPLSITTILVDYEEKK